MTPRVLVVSPGRVESSLTKAVLKGQRRAPCGHWPQVLFTQPEAPRSRAHQQHMKTVNPEGATFGPDPLTSPGPRPRSGKGRRDQREGQEPGPLAHSVAGTGTILLWALSGDLAV